MKNKRWQRKARKLHGKCMRVVSIKKQITKEILLHNPLTCCFCEFGIVDNYGDIYCKEDIWGASIRELEKYLKGE